MARMGIGEGSLDRGREWRVAKVSEICEFVAPESKKA